MKKPLLGVKIAVLVANGFSEKDLTMTQKNLLNAGANLRIVSMDQGLVNSWNDQGWGLNFAADQVLSEALAVDFDMLLVPGGQRSVDKLKLTAHTRRFVGGFMNASKPVALFEEAVELLIFAERASGHALSGSQAAQASAEAQGAEWRDAPYVTSGHLITGRSSDAGSEELSQEVCRFFIEQAENDKDIREAA